MRLMIATCSCCVKDCKVEIRIKPQELLKLVKAPTPGWSRQHFFCPAGHEQWFGDEAAGYWTRWLATNHPEILYGDRKPPPVEKKVEIPKETEEDKIRKLEAKMKDIDDFLARRGKYK